MFERLKLSAALLLVLALFLTVIPAGRILGAIAPKVDRSQLVTLTPVDPRVKTLAADNQNATVFRVRVTGSDGMPVPRTSVRLSTPGGLGGFSPEVARTDTRGEVLVTYRPPDADTLTGAQLSSPVLLKAASAYGEGSFQVSMTRNPLILVHGYKSGPEIFTNMRLFLTDDGFRVFIIHWSTTKGILTGAAEMEAFVDSTLEALKNEGVFASRGDCVAHSMGGLMVRYYSSSQRFAHTPALRKVIFISVPQKGSLWASLGSSVFTDDGMKDLIPSGPFLQKTLPGMLNGGLSPLLETASLLGLDDELVTPDSAQLTPWGIDTEVFSVGKPAMDFNSIISGDVLESSVHGAILSNKRVFERLQTLLHSNLPHPRRLK